MSKDVVQNIRYISSFKIFISIFVGVSLTKSFFVKTLKFKLFYFDFTLVFDQGLQGHILPHLFRSPYFMECS